MTVITLTDITRTRIDALSLIFFLHVVISWLVTLLWNHLAKTFHALPALVEPDAPACQPLEAGAYDHGPRSAITRDGEILEFTGEVAEARIDRRAAAAGFPHHESAAER